MWFVSELLDPPARPQAGREWQAWWTLVVGFEAQHHLTRGGQDHRAVHERVLEYHRAIEPSTCSALAGALLQPAADALFADACDWSGTVDRHEPIAGGQAPAWEVVRDAAEAVAEAHSVEPGRIDGAASILLVDGIWWDVAAPRFALCSRAAAEDPHTARAMLMSVFASGLAVD